MRISNLIPVLFLGAVCCLLLTPGRTNSPASLSPASAVDATSNAQTGQGYTDSGKADCVWAIPPASRAESATFLLAVSGRWHDALQVPLLEGNERILEGLTVSGEGIQPSRFRVSGVDESLKNTKEVTRPQAFRISPPTGDGYRLAQLRFSRTCVLYALKLVAENELLVRGPLPFRDLGTRFARLYEGFLAATAENTRLFRRFSEPTGQFTAVSSSKSLPNYVTQSSQAL